MANRLLDGRARRRYAQNTNFLRPFECHGFGGGGRRDDARHRVVLYFPDQPGVAERNDSRRGWRKQLGHRSDDRDADADKLHEPDPDADADPDADSWNRPVHRRRPRDAGA